MPFKNQDLGWIRVNFKKEEDKALRDFASKTNLAPVDWYEDLDEETKEAYNKNVLNKTANTYSAIYKFSPEEEQAYRDRFDIDYTAYIKDPIAANELHKKIMGFIQELIGDYRWDEWKTKMNLNEDLNQRKIKSWALFSDSILEKVYQKVTKEEDLDYLWNELSRKAISDDQQFAIDYFYNYRKMELGLDYNKELIGNMELKKDINELKEAALGFKPDATSRARASVETMMSNLDKTMEYLQGNAFVKTYKEEDAAKIKELTNVASDVIGDLLGIINATPDTKAKGMEEIRLKNYKPLGEEMDLDKTWADTFGDRAQELADKQRNFAMRDKVKVGDILYKDGRKGKVVKVMSDMANVDFGGGDVYGITFRRIKGDQIEESVNEAKTLKKGSRVKFKDGSSIYILGPKGDGYNYRDGRETGWHPKKWFDMMISTGKAVVESVNEGKYRVEYTTQDGEKAKSRVYNSEEEADKKEADLVNSGIKQAKVVKVEESVNEVKVDYDFSERELIRVLQKLKRGASGERGMIQAFIKALGRDITDDELFGESVNENIETLLSPEDLKYYRAHRDEIEDILNAEWRSSKLSAKDAVEKHKALNEDKKYKRGDKLKIKLKNGKEFDLTFDSYSRQSGVAFGKFKDEDGENTTKPFSLDAIIDEGTCGYNTDAKTGRKLNTPGGLEERIKTLVKEFTKQK